MVRKPTRKEIKLNKKGLRKNIVVAIILLIVGFYFLLMSLNNKEIIDLGTIENKDLNYKVYLNSNNYFENKYLDENKVYIRKLVDYIDARMNYNLEFKQKVSGEYTYYVEGIVEANKTNSQNGNYWRKEYVLSDPMTSKIDGSNKINISQNTRINLNKYNQIFEDFKNDYSISSDGLLKINLIVKTKYDNDFSKNNTKEAILTMNIPLGKDSFEITTNIKKKKTEDNLTKVITNNNIYIVILRTLGIGLMIISVVIIMKNLLLPSNKKENEYQLKIKKILDEYDGIIGTIETLPNLDNYTILKVKEFEELLDIYNEVKMPINYYENKRKNESSFIIINDKIAWICKIIDEESIEVI